MFCSFSRFRFGVMVIYARWSVARAFPPGRSLNVILAHKGEVFIFSEARRYNVLIEVKFSLYFYHC